MKLTYTFEIDRKMVEKEVGKTLSEKEWKVFVERYNKVFQKAMDKASEKVEDKMVWELQQEINRPAPRSIKTARKPRHKH